MFRFIKRLKEKIKLMNVLQPGDLVWSKMPLSRKELKKIEKEHQVRPYLVVDKSLFFIYAYQSSSKQSARRTLCAWRAGVLRQKRGERGIRASGASGAQRGYQPRKRKAVEANRADDLLDEKRGLSRNSD